jgi:molybdate transport system substrate-binding protein
VNGTNGQVGVLSIPAEINVIAEYPIAVVTEAAHPTLARAWIAFVLSDAGRAALESAGFLTPAATTERQ